MSKQNYTFISDNSCPIKDEADKCSDLDSIKLGFVKDEITTYQDNDDNYQSYHIEDNIINKADNIKLESFNVDVSNVLEIKTEKDDTQNSLLIIEDSFLVKTEIDIKKEILTFLNNDECNETYRTENITVNNDKSSDITIDTLNACLEIKIKNDCKNTSIQNSTFAIEDGLKVENDSFPDTNSSLLCSSSGENTNFHNYMDHNLSCHNDGVFIKIEQMSPEYSDIFKENIYEVKTEVDYELNNFETSINNLKSDQIAVKKYNTIKLKSITNCDKKPFKCDICQKSFSIKPTLKNHMFTHTDEKPYKCDSCQKSYTTKSSLKTHIFTHTGEKPHECNICQKLFTQKGHLNIHMLTHTGEKLHKCNICQKLFTYKSNLTTHMLTHTGEKPHKCNICQKSCARQSYLKTHMFTHADEKPYKCGICQKSYTTKSSLKTHMFTHTDEKPYSCDSFQKSYITNSSLKAHIFTHTGENPYKCNICLKSFTGQSTLNGHMFKYHINVISV